MMTVSNGNVGFAWPAGRVESGSEFGPRTPFETLPAGYGAGCVGTADGVEPGDGVAPGAGVVPEPGVAVGVAPGDPDEGEVGVPPLAGDVAPGPAPAPAPEPPGTPESVPAAAQAATPSVAAPIEVLMKLRRVMRNLDIKKNSDLFCKGRAEISRAGTRGSCLV